MTIKIENNLLIKICSTTAIIIAILLMLSKLVVYFLTGSLIILSSFTDSSLDFLVSFLNFLFFKYSLKPKDEEHRFGHTAIEDIASLIQAIIISCSACFIILHAIENILHQKIPTMDFSGIIVTIVALIFTTGLVVFQKYTVKKTNSSIIKADLLHYLSDILMNAGILVALLIIKFTGLYWIDSIIAIFIALYILHSAFEVGKTGYNNIMNTEIEDQEKEKITSILNDEKSISGYKNLRTRYLGSKIFIEVTIEVKKTLLVEDAEKILKKIEEKIVEKFKNSEIVITVNGI